MNNYIPVLIPPKLFNNGPDMVYITEYALERMVDTADPIIRENGHLYIAPHPVYSITCGEIEGKVDIL